MASKAGSTIPAILKAHEQDILSEWLRLLKDAGGTGGRIREAELATQCREFLAAFRQAAASGDLSDPQSAAFAPVREFLTDLSRSRAASGFSPGETAMFVLSLKQPLFDRLQPGGRKDAALAADAWTLTVLLDQFGLHVMEVYQRSREEVIIRQQQEIAELSTPVVKLWEGILALPLIGTLDSARTQVVMENLLQTIVDQNAEIAIIDITGVPTVDTLVAQHLLKTVAAARLMGADCIISGIRPQIAQTMVHLGVELNVTSKATLADALSLALQRTGRAVMAARPAAARI